MKVEPASVHFRILEKLCTMPEAVRGVSGVMLNRRFGEPMVIVELAESGLIRERGWDKGPGAVWIPTAEGERVYRRLAEETTHRGEGVAEVDGT